MNLQTCCLPQQCDSQRGDPPRDKRPGADRAIWPDASPTPQGGLSGETVRPDKILVVDDQPIFVKVITLHLAKAGFSNVIGTTDSTKAIELIRANRPHLVLLDISMPQVNGLDILAAVRSDVQLGHTPILIITAASGESTLRKSLDLGATGVIRKPVEAADLESQVRDALAMAP